MAIIDRPSSTMPVASEAAAVVADLLGAVGSFQSLDLDALTAQEELDLIRAVEVVRRRFDHGTDRLAGHLDRSGAFGLDGHRTAKAALKHLGRLAGAEAHGRLRAARALRELPAVEAAYANGEIPTAMVRSISRVAANPRVAEILPIADPVFAEMASAETFDDFQSWIRHWESLADADGAAQDAEQTHERRNVSFLHNAVDGSWTLRGTFGAAQGATLHEIFQHFEDAEFQADWAHARAEHGDGALAEHLPRTPRQRRADAMVEVFRRSAATPGDAKSPVPLVNLVIDQQTFEDEVRRTAGEPIDDDPFRAGRRSQTVGGADIPPADVVAAALVGHVRRVVVDARSNVIDLGRRRRLFTGSSREAAQLQGLLRGHSGVRCHWPGCNAPACRLQIDHRTPAARSGPTDIANSELFCGGHNRLKERGFVPVRGPDGEWTILRPDGQPLTPAV